jgi:hypothetical protein
MRACLHPCIAPGNYTFLDYWFNDAGVSRGWRLLWFPEATGSSCPQDALGMFDASQCIFVDVEGAFATVSGDLRVRGVFTFEIPYLTIADMKEVEAMGREPGFVDERIQSYPPQGERLIEFGLWPNAPAPPASCRDNSECECISIGL